MISVVAVRPSRYQLFPFPNQRSVLVRNERDVVRALHCKSVIPRRLRAQQRGSLSRPEQGVTRFAERKELGMLMAVGVSRSASAVVVAMIRVGKYIVERGDYSMFSLHEFCPIKV